MLEVTFYLFAQLNGNVFTHRKRLGANLLDQDKPLRQVEFVVFKGIFTAGHHNFNEGVHHDGEDGHTNYLNETAHDLLSDAEGV